MQSLAQRRKVCLKILTSFPSKEALLSSPSSPIMISNNIALPPNCDDYIGNESCTDIQKECQIDHCDTSKSNDAPSAPENQAKAKSTSVKKEKKVFPPPIPLLARTQNLASHMPWVLKRYYTSEGRLILKEEKVRHHEYFRAHRANGRLTLQLVPLDDDDDDMFLGTSEIKAAATCPQHEEINEGSRDHSIIGTKRFAGEIDKASIVANDELRVQNNDNGAVGGTNGALKCLKFNSVRSPPSCIFGVTVHPVRTVHG